jgi:hypothetical protein
MKEENLDIFVVDHISHFGKEPHYTDDNRNQLNLLHKLAKDLKRTQIRKGKIIKILESFSLCQD